MRDMLIMRLETLDDGPLPLLEQVEEMQHETRRVAQQFAEDRAGRATGNEEEDWLRAERHVCWSPQTELMETASAFRLVIGIPGVEAEHLVVALAPEAVVLMATRSRDLDSDSRIHFSDFGTGKLFRRIDFPSPVHVESAVISFENMLLKLSAAKLDCVDSAIPETAVAFSAA